MTTPPVLPVGPGSTVFPVGPDATVLPVGPGDTVLPTGQAPPMPTMRPTPGSPMTPVPPWLPPPRNTRRRVWWTAFAVLLAAVVGGAIWGAVAEINSTNSARGTDSVTDGGPTKVITATDRKCQVTVPANWEDAPKELKNAEASIQVGDLARGEYLAVFTDAKEDFHDFASFEAALKDHLLAVATETKIEDRRQLTVGSLHAVQYVVEGKVEGIRFIYWFTLVEGNRGYHQVVGWTVPSRRSEVEHTIQDVIQTFHELS
jgi:hypothetical protein